MVKELFCLNPVVDLHTLVVKVSDWILSLDVFTGYSLKNCLPMPNTPIPGVSFCPHSDDSISTKTVIAIFDRLIIKPAKEQQVNNLIRSQNTLTSKQTLAL